ncbi:response regulator transcription factor [Aliarcobacter butzleri]|uniref:Two-component response regulator n=1 Tax=Aliarcobacter butzleri (strain RM4018) TaxID=367737 RepID=A8EU73_ALIB4|nr:response regulator transcription factor [Aliarcobacter butzleri]MCP3649244.1 response regulator transcription factor [Arcobacter sp. DNRA7]ABV67497.1 two-component response regulator [Aliarcobacter butzleri RM4018]MCR1815418.1 response regulator transcription factor [Aliarcobacter butzleri]MCT7547412.1 response regulator transcription factor [Aliarcobacter butzleri]MDN5099923.1 response regulator transcription factor [Aliarcobacter butzleri]
MKSLKVLIVEDEIKLANLIKASIKELFFKVNIAKDGIEGLKKFQSFKPDIIISDITMPNLDGLEMCQRIREESNIPIVILSAYSQKEKLLKAIDLGINKYFIKPFDIEEFLEYLKNLSKNIKKIKTYKLKDNFVFDNNSVCLYKDEILINLTKREREFLNILIKNKNSLVKKEDIKTLLWNEDVSDERLRTFIKRLRLKTSKDLVENVSSQGYLISVFDN